MAQSVDVMNFNASLLYTAAFSPSNTMMLRLFFSLSLARFCFSSTSRALNYALLWLLFYFFFIDSAWSIVFDTMVLAIVTPLAIVRTIERDEFGFFFYSNDDEKIIQEYRSTLWLADFQVDAYEHRFWKNVACMTLLMKSRRRSNIESNEFHCKTTFN